MRERDAGREGGAEHTLRTVCAEQTDRWVKDCGGGGGGRGSGHGLAGCGERGPTERPPSVGDGGDRQAVAAVLGGKGGIGRRADSCP